MLEVSIRRKGFGAVGGAAARTILADVAFSVAAGERVCLFGPSGCGKTTILNLVAGLDRDLDGTIRRAPGRLAYVFQEPRLLPWRTCLDNVRLALGDAADADDRARRWLDAMGVGEAAAVYPQRLSLGMARRVAMARAFAVAPALMLLDEPFVSLDQATATRLRRLLVETMVAEGTTVVAVSHDPAEATMLGHRVLVMGGSPATVGRVVDVPLDEAARFDADAIAPFARAVASASEETSGSDDDKPQGGTP